MSKLILFARLATDNGADVGLVKACDSVVDAVGFGFVHFPLLAVQFVNAVLFIIT